MVPAWALDERPYGGERNVAQNRWRALLAVLAEQGRNPSVARSARQLPLHKGALTLCVPLGEFIL